MRKPTLVLLVLSVFLTIACNRDSEVDEFLFEWNAVTKVIVQKIEAGDIDGAKEYFDAKKRDLKSKLDSIQSTENYQISSESRKKLTRVLLKMEIR